MIRKTSIKLCLRIFPFLCLLIFPLSGMTQDNASNNDTIPESRVDQGNEGCFKCHGYFIFRKDKPERKLNKEMYPGNIIKRDTFYRSNHLWFSCTDCHDQGHTQIPHPDMKDTLHLSCIDCHGMNEKEDPFQFMNIEEEFRNSIHFKATEGTFTCWKCHDPHSYKTFTRYSISISKIVEYNNNMCLSCHDEVRLDQLKSSEKEILKIHDWLPNEYLHFKNVRCIECHSSVKENLLISHNILPGENAVRKCVECHSSNSLLLSSLYKYQSIENRKELGFVNGIILNNSYVIGANRNRFLNVTSQALLGLVIGILIIHVILRVVIFKK